MRKILFVKAGSRLLRVIFVLSVIGFVGIGCHQFRGNAGERSTRSLRTGTVLFAVDNEEFKGRIELADRGDLCSCSVYSTLGQLLFSIDADRDSVTIQTGGAPRRFGLGDHLSTIDFFSAYPFTFKEVVSILRGTFCLPRADWGEPDSVRVGGGVAHRSYRRDSLQIEILAGERKNDVREIRIAPAPVPRWRIQLSRFVQTGARHIECRLSASDYFIIQYDAPR